jgi:hypothetical protein
VTPPEWLLNLIDNFHDWRDGEEEQHQQLYSSPAFNSTTHHQIPKGNKPC